MSRRRGFYAVDVAAPIAVLLMPTIGTRIIALAYIVSACSDHGPERGGIRAGARDEGRRGHRAFWSDFHRRG